MLFGRRYSESSSLIFQFVQVSPQLPTLDSGQTSSTDLSVFSHRKGSQKNGQSNCFIKLQKFK